MKTNFNLVFNSVNTASFTGDIFNAKYFIDFSSLIQPEDFNKKYKMTFRIKTSTSVDILPTLTYILKINVNSRIYNQNNLSADYTLGALSNSLDDQQNGYLCIDTKPNDNPPVIIHSLDRLNMIGLSFYINETETLFTTIPDYILILNFEEV